jgi:hypothetical protein
VALQPLLREKFPIIYYYSKSWINRRKHNKTTCRVQHISLYLSSVSVMPADDDSQSSCPHVSGMRGVCDIQPTKLRQSVKENYEELSASIVDGKTMRENER